MDKKYLQQFREDLKEFHEVTQQFYNREITVPEYKAFSGGFGSYAQRGGEQSMLRLRFAGGEVNREQLEFLVNSIQKYKIDLLHFTTCQTIQVHNLTKENVCSLIEEAFNHGIITRGGGGDYPRNVMCSPLSGVAPEETFDVLPYAKACADYLLTFINKVKLPRKLKVAFSNNELNATHATMRDLGFVAKENGLFDVYAAGGIGRNPKMGVCVVRDLAPSKILYAVKTMVDVFVEHGNYTNRAASRTRYLQDTMGAEGFCDVFSQKLQENLETNELELRVTPDVIHKKGEGTLVKDRVISQKQEGLFSVLYHPIGGNPKPEFFLKLYHTLVMEGMQEVKLRITPNQGVFIINLTAKEAQKILAITEDSAKTSFEYSTACIGALICQVGIGRSTQLLEACVERVRKENFADKVLPRIHISGCPSSCATHQIGTLGFRGGKKPTDDGPQYAFAVYDNGCDKRGEERFGVELGVMLERDIPEFLVELGKEVTACGVDYATFREQHDDKFLAIVKKYL